MTMTLLSPDYPDAQSYAGDDYLAEYGYVNPKLDRLADQAAAAEGEERRKIFLKYVDLYRKEAPAIPIAQTAGLRWQRADIAGYVFNPIFPGGPASSYYYDLRRTNQ